MLGLDRHAVALVPHDPAWIALGEQASARVAEIGGAALAGVQHVGSTSVPGLCAKPILDIAGGLAPGADVEALQRKFVEAGYIYRGDSGEEGGHLLVLESAPDVRTLHLHLIAHDGTQWRNYLAFREVMRRDAKARSDYESLKRSLATTFAGNREAYTAGKKEFISGILARAELR